MEATSCVISFFEGPAWQVLGVLAFVLAFHFINRAVFARIEKQFDTPHNVWKISFVRALYHPLTYFIWGLALALIFDIVTYHFLGYHLINLLQIIRIGAVFAFGWFLLRWNKKVIDRMHQIHETKISPGKMDLLSKIGTIAAMIITIFLFMDVTGSSFETLLAFGGIGGIALAFASQQFVSNLFGGVSIYLTHPFSVGDWIQVPSQKIEGNVEEIGWYSTCVRSFDKIPIYVPNSIFNQSIVLNSSRLEYQRLHLKINVKQTDPILLWQAVERIKTLLSENAGIEHHMDNSVYYTKAEHGNIEMEITAYISWLNKKESVKQEILLKVLSILDSLSIKTR